MQLTEKEWVAKHLTGHPDGWEELIFHKSIIEDLEPGELAAAIDGFKRLRWRVDILLQHLEYEAG